MVNKKLGKKYPPVILIVDRLLLIGWVILGITKLLSGDVESMYTYFVCLNAFTDVSNLLQDYEYDTKGVSGWRT